MLETSDHNSFAGEIVPGIETNCMDTDKSLIKPECKQILTGEIIVQNKNNTPTNENINSAETHRKRKKNKRDIMGRVKRVKNDTDANKGVRVGMNSRTYTCSSSSDEDDFGLIVSNLPNSWNYKQFKEYIDKECGPVKEIEFLKNYSECKYSLKLTFQSYTECKHAYNQLKDKVVEGRKLVLEIEEPDTDSDMSETTHVTDCKSWLPDLDVWDIDPRGLYGLRLPFLKSLGITPPIDKWVQVNNFRCDKSELRDILELAGHVLLCSVFTIADKYAKVMYSHPLEAVQAVSMLNGQQYYGKTLKVTMDRCPNDTVVLPKGLENIGSGLGLNGRPLRNIVKHYHRFLKKESSEANTCLFEINEDSSGNRDFKDLVIKEEDVEMKQDVQRSFKVMKVDDLCNLGADKEKFTVPKSPDDLVKKSFSPIPVQATAEVRPVVPNQTIVTVPTLPDVHSQFGTFVQRQQGPVSNVPVRHSYPAPRFGFGPIVRPQGPVNVGMPGIRNSVPVARPPVSQMYPPQSSCTIQMSNLPPTTTFPLLCEKLSHCGQVLSLQFTTPGCAVIRFAQSSHAHTCYQFYNGFNVEGYVIGVTFV